MIAWRSRRAKVAPVPPGSSDARGPSATNRGVAPRRGPSLTNHDVAPVASGSGDPRALATLEEASASAGRGPPETPGPGLLARLGLGGGTPAPNGGAAAAALDALASALAEDRHARACLAAMQEAIAVVEGPRFDDDVDGLALAELRMDTLLCDEPVLDVGGSAPEVDATGPRRALDGRASDETAPDETTADETTSDEAGARPRTRRREAARDRSADAGAAMSLRERAGSWRDSASHAALRQVLRAHGETFVEQALRGALPGVELAQHRAGLELAAASHAGLFEVFPNSPGRGRTRAWVRDVVSGVALPLLDPLGGVEALVELTSTSAPLALWELRLALTRRGAWMIRPPLDYPEEAAEIARALQPWRRCGAPRLDLLRLRRARAAWHRAGRRASFAAFIVG